MATKILLKKSVTGGASPLTSDLDQGELAINLVDRKIYTKDNGNNIKEITGAYVDAVAPSNPVEGDLWYDSGNNLLKSYNGSTFESAGYQTVGALEDVTLTSIASGDHLTWNGTAFVNSNLESDVEGFMSAATTGTGHGDLTYSNGVYTFDKVTSAEVRADISVTDNGGDGSLSYDNATGVISYTGPSQAEVLAHVSGGKGVSVDAAGEIALDFSEYNTSDMVEDPSATVSSGTMYYTDARARAAISLTDNGGDGSASYNPATGVIEYTGPSAAEARAHISVTDAGGDGSASYDAASGVITYTGPSAAEVRAHHTGGTGVTITAGEIAIGQPVATSDNVEFAKVTTNTIDHTGTITLNPNSGGAANEGTVVIAGDLTVEGTTTTVNSNEVNIGDSIILLNSDETGAASQNAGIEIERGTDANKSFIWDETSDAWTLNDETLEGVIIDGGTY